MALSQSRNTIEIAEQGRILYLPVAAGVKIYEGAFVAVNAAGYAVPASKSADLRAAGRAETFADNSSGIDGAIGVNVKQGVFVWDNDSTAANAVKQEHQLSDCYLLDDCTVTTLSTGTSKAGRVIAITDEGIAVETL